MFTRENKIAEFTKLPYRDAFRQCMELIDVFFGLVSIRESHYQSLWHFRSLQSSLRVSKRSRAVYGIAPKKISTYCLESTDEQRHPAYLLTHDGHRKVWDRLLASGHNS
jgi:hypothetical protein